MHSRRQFLKITGIVLGGSQLGINFIQASSAEDAIYGRALAAAPIYQRPSNNSPLITRLWPDSVTPILDVQEGWYQLANGYIQREMLQPVAPFLSSDTPIQPEPSWAEVSAPVATVRDYCGAQAPLVTRIGHGGVARIVDYLPDDSGGWYAIGTDDETILGWSQAAHWQPVEIDPPGAVHNLISIDLKAQRLTAWENGETVLQAPCSTDLTLTPGRYTPEAQSPGWVFAPAGNSTHIHGVPWTTSFGDNLALGGVYWHNRFGKQTPGMAVQVTPLIARWLYGWLGIDGEIHVV